MDNTACHLTLTKRESFICYQTFLKAQATIQPRVLFTSQLN